MAAGQHHSQTVGRVKDAGSPPAGARPSPALSSELPSLPHPRQGARPAPSRPGPRRPLQNPGSTSVLSSAFFLGRTLDTTGQGPPPHSHFVRFTLDLSGPPRMGRGLCIPRVPQSGGPSCLENPTMPSSGKASLLNLGWIPEPLGSGGFTGYERPGPPQECQVR